MAYTGRLRPEGVPFLDFRYINKPLLVYLSYKLIKLSHFSKLGFTLSTEGNLKIPGGPGVTCGLSLLLVLYSAPRCLPPDTAVFLSSQKPTFLNSNSTLECTAISERVLVNSPALRGSTNYTFAHLYIYSFRKHQRDHNKP